MTKEQLQEIQDLEKALKKLLGEGKTLDEKLKILSDSYWRSHNSSYCDHIAGMLMGGESNSQTDQHDYDCKYKWEVSRLIDLLNAYKEETK